MSSRDEQIAGVRQALSALHVQRQSLEQEAEAIVSELTDATQGHAPMGIDTPLTDSEGYPRADIDLYRARTLRGRLAEIKTDHKELEQDMERHLHLLASLQNSDRVEEERKENAARQQAKPKPVFDRKTGKWVVRNWDGSVAGTGKEDKRSFDTLNQPEAAAAAAAAAEVAATTTEAKPSVAYPAVKDEEILQPFARVNSVAPDSPAAAAGLSKDDRILSFGPVALQKTVEMDCFRELPDLVQRAAAAHETIEVRILRQYKAASDRLSLRLQPRAWGGRGLIGCHIVPDE
jgi:26S proteasome non-ATPase regulatory subunit 9